MSTNISKNVMKRRLATVGVSAQNLLDYVLHSKLGLDDGKKRKGKKIEKEIKTKDTNK